ncbi:MAG: HIT family protein, partial [Spirochaetota bacterium]
ALGMRNYLFNTEKLKYITGQKRGGCILCAIRDRSEDVRRLELCRSEYSIVTVNLYPFNPGHLMIFPVRHCTDLSVLSDEEALDMHRMSAESIQILRDEFSPVGFNIGYNMGQGSGASIDHLHLHIVPRYTNEVGFIDVLAGDRVMVVDPVEVMEKLAARFIALDVVLKHRKEL